MVTVALDSAPPVSAAPLDARGTREYSRPSPAFPARIKAALTQLTPSTTRSDNLTHYDENHKPGRCSSSPACEEAVCDRVAAPRLEVPRREFPPAGRFGSGRRTSLPGWHAPLPPVSLMSPYRTMGNLWMTSSLFMAQLPGRQSRGPAARPTSTTRAAKTVHTGRAASRR
jgi:hypothetical protein